jgi:hypothetical protein
MGSTWKEKECSGCPDVSWDNANKLITANTNAAIEIKALAA